MQSLPDDIKLTYYVAIFIMVILVFFIILIVVFYNRKQTLFIKEKQLAESEHQKQILQNELEKQKLIVQERERISHDMHDDLGAGISAMKLQAEFLKQKIKDETVLEDIDDLLKTSEEMNISMREMLWSLNSQNDTIGNLIKYASSYAENFFRKTAVKVKINEENICSDQAISAEQRRNIFLCIKEALNNVYKHSEASLTEVFFEQENSILHITVKDNGKGIGADVEKGNGMNNMQFRMREIGGTFTKEVSSFGTLLHFSIDLQNRSRMSSRL